MEKSMNKLSLGQGLVYHSRHEGHKNKFGYPSFFVFFNCQHEENLKDLMRHKFYRFLSFKTKDYLERKNEVTLDKAIKKFLYNHCNYEAQDVWLHTMPRMFGYAFNPVSFWCCYKNDSLDAVLVEVHNTFGESHFYWLNPHGGIVQSEWYTSRKVFHVSPFFPVDGFYKFRFQISLAAARVDINYYSPEGDLRLATWVEGQLSILEHTRFFLLLLKYGWITPLVVARIHFQAFKLWIKKEKFYSKPPPPQQEIT